MKLLGVVDREKQREKKRRRAQLHDDNDSDNGKAGRRDQIWSYGKGVSKAYHHHKCASNAHLDRAKCAFLRGLEGEGICDPCPPDILIPPTQSSFPPAIDRCSWRFA